MTVEHARRSGDGEWDGHLILLPRSDEEREAGVTSWVVRGLETHARIVYAEDPGTADDRSLLATLSRHGLEGRATDAADVLTQLPVERLGAADSVAALCDEALRAGFSSLRLLAVAADAVNQLGEQGYFSAERKIDELHDARPVHAMCQYAHGGLPDGVIAGGIAVHPGGVRETLFQTRFEDDALIVAGEIDAHNDPLFGEVIRAVMDTASEVVRLGFGDVTFLGVGGVRSIVRGSAEFRERGGRVELMRPPADIVRLLRILSLEEIQGIEIKDGES